MCPANKTLSRSYLHLRVHPCCPLSRCSFFFPSSFESPSLMTVSFYNAIFSDKLFWLDLIKKSRVTTKKHFIYSYRALYVRFFIKHGINVLTRTKYFWQERFLWWMVQKWQRYLIFKILKIYQYRTGKVYGNLLQIVCSTDIAMWCFPARPNIYEKQRHARGMD